MKQSIKFISIAFCLLFSTVATSQIIKGYSAALLNETVEITPFNDFTPINPGIELGVNFWRKDGKNFGKQFNSYLGFYHHKNVSNAFYLKGEYVFQTKIKGMIGIDLIPSIGYQHYFYPGDVFEFNESTNEYEKGNQLGIPRLTGGLGLGLTYLNNSKIEPFVRYEVVVDFPQKLLTALPHTIFKIGVNYRLQNQ